LAARLKYLERNLDTDEGDGGGQVVECNMVPGVV
jgi:hypothetical protein